MKAFVTKSINHENSLLLLVLIWALSGTGYVFKCLNKCCKDSSFFPSFSESFFWVYSKKKKKSSQIVNYIQFFQGNRLLNVFIYTRDEYKGVHLHLHKTF